MSPTFANVLASGRPDFNRRFIEARNRFPDLTAERFRAVLRDYGDAIVLAAEKARTGISGTVGQVVFDAALALAGQRLVGPDARHSAVNEIWRDVLPMLGSLIALDSERVIAALSNAAHHLAAVPGTQVKRWVGTMRELGPRCDDLNSLLALGQVVAWRAGLAHFRTSALDAADRMPSSLALAAVGAPDFYLWPAIRTRLVAEPFFNPAEPTEKRRLRIAVRAGSFRGFGGIFATLPRVQRFQNQWVARCGNEAWLLIADAFGATFHRMDPAGLPPLPTRVDLLSSAVTLREGTVKQGRESLELAEFGTLTSATVSEDGKSMAFTADGTHAIMFVVLP